MQIWFEDTTYGLSNPLGLNSAYYFSKSRRLPDVHPPLLTVWIQLMIQSLFHEQLRSLKTCCRSVIGNG